MGLLSINSYSAVSLLVSRKDAEFVHQYFIHSLIIYLSHSVAWDSLELTILFMLHEHFLLLFSESWYFRSKPPHQTQALIYFYLCFETDSHYTDQTNLKLIEIYLPLYPKYWNQGCASPPPQGDTLILNPASLVYVFIHQFWDLAESLLFLSLYKMMAYFLYGWLLLLTLALFPWLRLWLIYWPVMVKVSNPCLLLECGGGMVNQFFFFNYDIEYKLHI